MNASPLIYIWCLLFAIQTTTSLAQERPVLSCELADAGHVRLSWPRAAVNFVLEERREFSVDTDWTSCSDTPTIVGEFYTVLVSIDAETSFYRLRYQSGGDGPPDPSTVAAPLDSTIVTDFGTATEFLYADSNAIQTGVASGTIEPHRASVLRGRVLSTDGGPLAGVRISIREHSEYGATQTRADGSFDMAVNGGGMVAVDYQKSGYLPAQRQINTRWQDYTWLPGVVLIPRDAQGTSVQLGATSPAQVARGNTVSDSDGSRQATLFFPQGIEASVILADGTTQPVPQLNVRATEYTVGPNGPAAMPAELPPTSAYTYCVELSADEAIAKVEGKDVLFSKPVMLYVDNFLDLPPGLQVPTAYYDSDKASWIPVPDGRVIKIMAIETGIAVLDSDGNGSPDDSPTLSALGISDDERRQLASLYSVGATFWRTSISHFSTYDCNYGAGPDPAAVAPKLAELLSELKLKLAGYGCPVPQHSIIDVQDQILRENRPLAGTPFSLHYASDRVTGRRTAYSLQIPLTPPELSPLVRRIQLKIEIAGRVVHELFAPTNNLVYTFDWDGRDGYGRRMQGVQALNIRVGYDYDTFYFRPPEGTSTFGLASADRIPGDIPARERITLWQDQRSQAGAWEATGLGLGGWTLDVHHAYDPIGRTLYFGDGRQRTDTTVHQVIETFAGNGEMLGLGKDGDPAVNVPLPFPGRMAVAPDGTLYIPELMIGNRVRKVGPDGIMRTTAGTGSQGVSGDGGPALSAKLYTPSGVALGPDGSLYIADSMAQCVRRVDRAGIINTVAGQGGIKGNTGDGGLATQATLTDPYDVAVGPDGSLYIADTHNFRVRKVSPNGIISNFAGDGRQMFAGDSGPAAKASLYSPVAVEIGADGSVYIADMGNYRIRCVDPSGVIRTVAGNGSIGSGDEAGPAISTSLGDPTDLVVTPEGYIYVTTYLTHRVRLITPQGRVFTIAGNGPSGAGNGKFEGDGGAALDARFNRPQGIALSPDGSIFVGDSYNFRVRRIRSAMPGFGRGEIAIPSDDGSELFLFDPAGRHLRTLDTLTGVTLFQFEYDTVGRVTTIEDAHHYQTRIEHSTDGAVATIKAPFGQKTKLEKNSDGYLTAITGPLNSTFRFAYHGGGLLKSVADPNLHETQFQYDASGRLTRDENPVGGFAVLEYQGTPIEETVSFTTAELRAGTYQTQRLYTGERRHINVLSCCGGTNEMFVDRAGVEFITMADGSTLERKTGPDPRFGLSAPMLQRQETRTPGGLHTEEVFRRVATLAVTNDPLSLKTFQQTVTRNGQIFSVNYTAADRRMVHSTPEGRQTITTLDPKATPVRIEAPKRAPLELTYDQRGRLIATAQGTRRAQFEYDEVSGHLAAVTSASGAVTRYAWNAAGQITSVTERDGSLWTYERDKLGNPLSVTEPGAINVHRFAWTPINLLQSYRTPLGAEETFHYDRDGNLIRRQFASGESLRWEYDSAGQLVHMHSPQGTNHFTCEPLAARLVQETSRDGQRVDYTYDGPLLTRADWSQVAAGSIRYAYDNNFRIAQMDYAGISQTNSYDKDGLLNRAGGIELKRDRSTGWITNLTHGGFQIDYTYNNYGELSGIKAAQAGQLYHLTYEYDDSGRITRKIENLAGQTVTSEYSYNVMGQLTQTHINGELVESYAYDPAGNRTGMTNRLTNRTLTAADLSYDADHKLLAAGNTDFTYDPNGRLHSFTRTDGTVTATYNLDGTLGSVELPNGRTITYLHDNQGRRVARLLDGARSHAWLYGEGPLPLAEFDGSGNLRTVYIYASDASPVALIRNGTTYHIVSDHLASPRLLIDSVGEVVKRIDYDSYGNVLADSNPSFDLPFGFAAGMADPEHELVRFGARDYQPSCARWTAPDPTIDFSGGNLFAYASNDPINAADRTGLQAGGISTNVHKQDGKWIASFGPQRDYEMQLVGKNVVLVSKIGNQTTKIYPTYDPVAKIYSYRINNVPFRITESDYAELFKRVAPQPGCSR